MSPAELIAWHEAMDAAGQPDPMGLPWRSWLIAVRRPDGSMARDARGHQIFETQAEYKARMQAVPIGQTLELFA
jgi:hypothetical protein